jgi:hypothetical protein
MNPLRTPIAVAALLLALGLLTACGSDKQKDSLEGPIGPGSGGPAVAPATLVQANLTKPDGTVIGSLAFDTAFFTPLAPPPASPGSLTNMPNGISILMTNISGRPDTPCRFNAAILARDSGYEIGDTGFRTNALGQELYQVNLSSSGSWVRLFCANLRDNVGLQFAISANAPDKVSWLQVYYVMNSLHAQ